MNEIEHRLAAKVVMLTRAYDATRDMLREALKAYHIAMNIVDKRKHTGEWESCTEETCIAAQIHMDRVHENYVK